MSTPKRAVKKTTTTKTAAARPKLASAKKATAKKTSVKKIVKTAVKKAVKKTASTTKAAAKTVTKKLTGAARPRLASASASASASSTSTKVKKAAKKVVKKTTAAAKSATTKAQKVAKKIAKIISKVVAKKKAANAPARPRLAAATAAAARTTHTLSKKTAAAATKPAAKKTPAPRRPKTFASPEVQHTFGFPADAPELPETYGEDRLVLMTKDPEYLFAYWEVTPEKMSAGEKAKRRGEDYREALRLNWASRDIFERNFAVLPIALGARKWYLRVPFSGLAYQVEIGWLGESGHFVSLLTSNPSDAPESWNATRRRLKHAAESGGVLGRALAAGRPQGSSDLSSLVGTPEVSPTPIDWNFTGPGSQTSSFGKPGKANKAKTSGSRSAAS